MAATTFIAFPVWSMLMLGGFVGLPLSVPPLPEDPALARIAPEECLWYMSAAGMAVPNAESDNQTEQLLAEPEIQQLFAGLEDQIVRLAHLQAGSEQERMLATEVPPLIKLALTAPLAAYVADVQPDPDGGPPTISAGLVLKLGDRAGEVERSVDTLLSALLGLPGGGRPVDGWNELPLPPEAPPVRWGIRDGWLVLGVGDGEAERLAERLASAASPPEWLAQARSELPVERRSTLGYLNLAGILERVQPMIGPQETRMIEVMGLTSVQALFTTSGMDERACVTKGLVALDGPPRGVLELLPHEPLSRDDLEVVPEDATFAIALRLDARETLDRILALVGTIEPSARREMEDGMWQAESELGIDIRNDLLGSLDDRVVVYMPGGQLFTAWTGTTAVVDIRDRRQLERTLDKLAVVARLHHEPAGGRSEGVRFQESEFRDYTLHYVQFIGQPVPFTPAWCVTDEHFVAGATPQAVKSAIARLEQDGGSLAELDVVTEALDSGSGPAFLSYVDTQSIVRGLYPMMTWGLQAMASEMAREGFDFDIALLPSVEAIASHLVPSVSTWRLSPEGFRFEAHQSLPGGDLVSSAPVAAAMLLPAITSARSAARRTQDMNNLRQLALGFHNYVDVHGQFPTNVYDANGKALLSWRVRLLPYLEQQALYEQFRLDEAWDSPNNKPLVEHMPPMFGSSSLPVPPGQTRFVALAHKDSLFPGDQKLGFGDVPDGTSNTLMFVQAAPESAVDWTKPEDIPFDPDNPRQGLTQPDGHFLTALCDGSVRRLFIGIDEETLRRLVYRNDGQPIDLNELDR